MVRGRREEGDRTRRAFLAPTVIRATLAVSLALWLDTTAGIAQDGGLRRLVSGIPAAVPAGYAALLVLGLLGTPVARPWWPRIWPPETAADYAGRAGYWAACGVRFLAFTLVFLPLTAVVAAPWNLGSQLWELVRGPLRGLRRFAALARWRQRASPPARDRAADKQAQPENAERQAPSLQVPPTAAPARVSAPPSAAPPPVAPMPAPAVPAPSRMPPPPPLAASVFPVLPMPALTRVPAPPRPTPAPAMSAPPKPPPAGPARVQPPWQDHRRKPPARSWIANLPKDEDME